jgi:hypothetical protein
VPEALIQATVDALSGGGLSTAVLSTPQGD